MEEQITNNNKSLTTMYSTRDVVYLGCMTNSALVYEPKCGGWGEVEGSQPMTTDVYRSPNTLWRSNSIFNLCTVQSLVLIMVF